jgi:outer membrane protein, heavy metal efflux system
MDVFTRVAQAFVEVLKRLSRRGQYGSWKRHGLAAAHIEVTTLKTQILPGAQSAFDAASTGYRLGKFGFLDVLDAQRTLFEAKAQYLRALASYHQALAEVERLIGEPVEAAEK